MSEDLYWRCTFVSWLNEETLVKFVRRARERWPDFEVVKIVQKKSKQIIYASFNGNYIKIIVDRGGKIRVYGGVGGTSLAVKNILSRVLGFE